MAKRAGVGMSKAGSGAAGRPAADRPGKGTAKGTAKKTARGAQSGAGRSAAEPTRAGKAAPHGAPDLRQMGRLEAETSEMIAAIGARLRALRTAKGLTLQALATRAGLSSSMLSLLERGKTGPSIGTLVVICSVLGAEMSDLLGPSEPAARDPVSRFANRPVFATADGVLRRILKSDPVRGVEIAINEYSAGTSSSARPVTHEGYEFGVALEGELEITVNGEVHRLGEGDLVSYHSTEPHRIVNPGKRRARALWVNLRRA